MFTQLAFGLVLFFGLFQAAKCPSVSKFLSALRTLRRLSGVFHSFQIMAQLHETKITGEDHYPRF
jgi:hypothetical protein